MLLLVAGESRGRREEVCMTFINHFIRREFKVKPCLNKGCRQGGGHVYSDVSPYVSDLLPTQLVWASKAKMFF